VIGGEIQVGVSAPLPPEEERELRQLAAGAGIRIGTLREAEFQERFVAALDPATAFEGIKLVIEAAAVALDLRTIVRALRKRRKTSEVQVVLPPHVFLMPVDVSGVQRSMQVPYSFDDEISDSLAAIAAERWDVSFPPEFGHPFRWDPHGQRWAQPGASPPDGPDPLGPDPEEPPSIGPSSTEEVATSEELDAALAALADRETLPLPADIAGAAVELGRVHRRAGDAKAARSAFERARCPIDGLDIGKLDPGKLSTRQLMRSVDEATLELARLTAESGSLEEIVIAYEGCASSTWADVKALMVIEVADHIRAAGFPAQASIAILERAKTDGEIAGLMGLILDVRGEGEEARRVFESGVIHDDGLCCLRLGRLLIEEGSPEDGARLLHEAMLSDRMRIAERARTELRRLTPA
jgi:hypothetical protein